MRMMYLAAGMEFRQFKALSGDLFKIDNGLLRLAGDVAQNQKPSAVTDIVRCNTHIPVAVANGHFVEPAVSNDVLFVHTALFEIIPKFPESVPVSSVPEPFITLELNIVRQKFGGKTVDIGIGVKFSLRSAAVTDTGRQEQH